MLPYSWCLHRLSCFSGYLAAQKHTVGTALPWRPWPSWEAVGKVPSGAASKLKWKVEGALESLGGVHPGIGRFCE